MVRRFFHDLLAHALAAGEEDVVKPFLQQSGVFRPASGDHRHIFRPKALADQALHQGAGAGRVGAGLDYGGVSGGDGVHQGIQGEHKGVVPRAHDEYRPVGGGLFIAAGGELGQGRGHRFLPREGRGVPAHIAQLAEHQAGLAQIALAGALAQVLLKRLGDGRLVGLNAGPEPVQRPQAEVHAQGGSGLKIGALPVHDLPDFQLSHVSSS